MNQHQVVNYKLVQCPCCNMQYNRRMSTIRGNDPLFYNRAHWLRYKYHEKKRVPLSEQDLMNPKCITPGQTVLWLKDHLQPFALI